MTRTRPNFADVASYTTIALEAAWYVVLDAHEALTRAFRRGWALGLERARHQTR